MKNSKGSGIPVDRYAAELEWINVIFLFGTPFLSIVLLITYLNTEAFNPGFIWLFFAFYIITGIAMTGGYHRLYSHRAYKASKPLELFYLLFGAAALQNSVLFWADDHRRHHLYVDTDGDPYNAKRGLWFSHMAWVLYKDSYKERNEANVPDLTRNKLIMWQHKYYWPLAVLMGFGLPTLIGYFMGSAFGGFIFGGILRVVVVHQLIFLINSFAHYWGTQNYSDENTARDNSILAVLTYGEGYHNFHHVFEADYRNGVRWFNWDPTKWFIGAMSFFGLAHELRRINDTIILRARLAMEKKKLMKKSPDFFNSVSERLDILQSQLIEIRQRIHTLKNEYRNLKNRDLRAEIKNAKREFRLALAQWRSTMGIAA
jgi:stearoyl-CoA desaturase (Delta-9 desaturase)